MENIWGSPLLVFEILKAISNFQGNLLHLCYKNDGVRNYRHIKLDAVRS